MTTLYISILSFIVLTPMVSYSNESSPLFEKEQNSTICTDSESGVIMFSKDIPRSIELGLKNIEQTKFVQMTRFAVDASFKLENGPFFGHYDLKLKTDGQELDDELHIFVDQHSCKLSGLYQVPGGFSSNLYDIMIQTSGKISFIISVPEGKESYELIFKGQIDLISKNIQGVVKRLDGTNFGEFFARSKTKDLK